MVLSLRHLAESGRRPEEVLAGLKAHPAIAPYLKGATLKEYGAHLIPEGGYDHMPALHTDGMLVAGDAAGLLDPWTREGISFALRSGALAGAAAASGDLAQYESTVESTLAPVMAASRRLLRLFERHPGACHAAVATPPGWRLFSAVCRGELDLAEVVRHRSVRAALALLGR